MENVAKIIRAVPDFPKEGILFRDITPVLADAKAFERVIDVLVERYQGQNIQQIAAIESRGFIFGAPLALRLGVGLTLIRKPGKLPCETISASYELEYGTDTLEMHADALTQGDRVVIIDDLIATGGTAQAAARLVREAGGDVAEMVAIIELSALDGRKKLEDVPVHSLLSY
ncbi:adenine phosphoribosyltransferase [Myxococcota bacterium]|nr:adenine phosphoribosyltransferase [Myxococcota bacterium]